MVQNLTCDLKLRAQICAYAVHASSLNKDNSRASPFNSRSIAPDSTSFLFHSHLPSLRCIADYFMYLARIRPKSKLPHVLYTIIKGSLHAPYFFFLIPSPMSSLPILSDQGFPFQCQCLGDCYPWASCQFVPHDSIKSMREVTVHVQEEKFSFG